MKQFKFGNTPPPTDFIDNSITYFNYVAFDPQGAGCFLMCEGALR